ncbi:MAG: hypothetical protein QM775_22295 [Pirellulales bacterium]
MGKSSATFLVEKVTIIEQGRKSLGYDIDLVELDSTGNCIISP